MKLREYYVSDGYLNKAVYENRQKIKELGFKFDPERKIWSRFLLPKESDTVGSAVNKLNQSLHLIKIGWE